MFHCIFYLRHSVTTHNPKQDLLKHTAGGGGERAKKSMHQVSNSSIISSPSQKNTNIKFYCIADSKQLCWTSVNTDTGVKELGYSRPIPSPQTPPTLDICCRSTVPGALHVEPSLRCCPELLLQSLSVML